MIFHLNILVFQTNAKQLYSFPVLSRFCNGLWNIHERGFTIPKTISHCKKWKNMKHFVSPSSNLAPKMVVPLASPGRIIVVLFWTKYAVHRRIKSGILNLIIRGGQSNYSIVFIFVSNEEKNYCCVVSVGQLIFDCRSYCGLSRRMQIKIKIKGNLLAFIWVKNNK